MAKKQPIDEVRHTLTYRYRDVVRRRAYLRDYMKRRRARKRLEREEEVGK